MTRNPQICSTAPALATLGALAAISDGRSAHGAALVPLSWGCAPEVVTRIDDSLANVTARS
jgi:hypothetical protein